MLCDFGCGTVSNFQLKNGKQCCSKRPAGCPVLKEVNSVATKKAYETGIRTSQKEVYQNLPQEIKDSMNWAKGKTLTPNELVFAENSNYSNAMVKHRIVENDMLNYCCSICSLDTWQGETIVLDLDHINGNNVDNRLLNLRFLCPNCHSQTDTYKGRNKNTGKLKVTDIELLTAYEKCSNIRQALIEVGLAAKGGNYERLKKLIKK